MKRIFLLLSILALSHLMEAQLRSGSSAAASLPSTARGLSAKTSDAVPSVSTFHKLVPQAAATQTAGSQPNNVTGFYSGTLQQPNNGTGYPTFQFEMTLTEDAAGNVTGQSHSVVYGTSYFITELISGNVSNGVLTFQQTGTVAESQAPFSWCSITAQLTVSGGGYTLSGPFQGESDCTPGTISITRNDGRLLGGDNEPGTCSCTDPININSGNVHETYIDYQSYARYPLSFIRYYNSRALSTAATELATNWRSNYDRYLNLSATSVVAERADGEQITFTLSGSKWVANTDVDITLVQSGTTWLLTDSDDGVESYSQVNSALANLQSIRLRNGYTQTLSYNSSNQLSYAQDSFYNTLGFSYQSNGLLSQVSTPEGTTITFGYAASSGGPNLVTATFSGTPQQTITYVYGSSIPNALTGVLDENGNTYESWTYDQFGRGLTNVTGAGANATTVSYNDNTSARTVTNALGVVDIYNFTTLQGVPKLTEIDRQATATTAAAKQTFTYDSNGYLSGKTDWNGNTSIYINDFHGQPQTVTEAYGSPVVRTTSITYDPVWVHLPSTISTQGLTTSLKYDSAGNLQTKTLTDTTSFTTPYQTSGSTRTWTYSWLNYQPTSITGPRTDLSATRKFGYDRWGTLVAITNALGQQTTITKHTSGGRPQTIVDPNGVTTHLTYDNRQRLISSAVTTAAGVLTTTLVYDAAGNPISVTKPDGSTLTNQYDTAHRLIKVTDSLGNYKSYTLDALGDATKIGITRSGGTLTWQTSGTFDALGRLLTSAAGAGQTTTQTFDPNGNVLSTTDGLGHKTTYVYDALNRVNASTDANAGITKTGLDAHDRVVSVTDANGNSTSYTRNGFGDVIQRISPDSGTAVFHVDGDSNVTSKTDALGIVTNQTFDALDRPLMRTYPASAAENVTFAYDQAAASFGIGRLTSVRDQAGTLTRQYDERGDLLREQRVNGANTLTTSYGYDKASRIAAMTYPDGTLVSYQHDAAGYLSNVSAKLPGSSTTTQIATLTHQPFGPLGSVAYGNGVSESWTFDQSYRPLTIVDALSGMTLQNLTYAYDLADNPTSITDGVSAANSQTLGYDPLNRLNSAVSGSGGYGTLAWQYDPVGNRRSQTLNGATTTYGYISGSNRLSTISPGLSISAVKSSLPAQDDAILPNQDMSADASSRAGLTTMPTGPPKDTAIETETLSTSQTQTESKPLQHLRFRPALATGSPLQYATNSRGYFKPAAYIVNIPSPPALPPSATVYGPFLFSIPYVPNIRVFYTENGTTPTTSSYLYTGPFWVGSSLLIRAIAVTTNGYSSGIASAQYLFATAPPAFSLAGGSYSSYQTLTISDATPGATIYYTTDGSTPTNNSPQYNGPISIQHTETVAAVAALGNAASTLTSATYTLPPTAAAPVFSPPAGSFSSVQTVTLTDPTPAAAIYYTTDGTMPTTASPRYTSPITVGTTETLQAIATAAGYFNSAVASSTYNVTLPTLSAPIFGLLPPTAMSYATISLRSFPAGFPSVAQTLFYTTDGTTPTTSSFKYTSPFVVSATTTINAIATATGYLNSSISTKTVQFSILPTPIISPASGTYSAPQSVTLTDSQFGSHIFYTLDGSTPTSNSTVYTAPIAVTGTGALKAIAVPMVGLGSSSVASASYTISSSIVSVATNANGNITSIPPANGYANATFGYNNANRLQSVTGSPVAASYIYDAFGQRFSKTNPGTPPTLYSYGPAGMMLVENDNGTVTDYIYADGRPLAQIQPGATPIVNQVSYVIADRLGTPQRETNSTGNTVWSTTYQPFGMAGAISASVNQNLRSPGQIVDIETGFNYNDNRDYMPSLGRFLETDPIGLLGGSNTYSYVNSSPLDSTDPTGLYTYAVGPTVTFSGERQFSVTAQVTVSRSTTGNWLDTRVGGSVSVVPLTGISTGIGVAGGLTTTISPSATTNTQWNGLSTQYGGSVTIPGEEVPLVVGIDVGNISPNGSNNPIRVDVFTGRGMKLAAGPIELHAATGYTCGNDRSLRQILDGLPDVLAAPAY